MSSKGSGGLGQGLDALLGNTVSSDVVPKKGKAGIEKLKNGDCDDFFLRPKPRWPLDPHARKV